MLKNVIITAVLGTIILFVWTFVVNGIFRFQAGVDMKQIDKEQQVYEVLKEHIVEPGRYVFFVGPSSDDDVLMTQELDIV